MRYTLLTFIISLGLCSVLLRTQLNHGHRYGLRLLR